jgi:hypothetical protein
MGFKPSSDSTILKLLESPVEFKEQKSDDLLVQLATHEKFAQTIMLQFDVNPKLQMFDEWRKDAIKFL